MKSKLARKKRHDFENYFDFIFDMSPNRAVVAFVDYVAFRTSALTCTSVQVVAIEQWAKVKEAEHRANRGMDLS